MKIDFVKSVVAIAICGLIAYGFYALHNSDNKLLLSLGCFFFTSVTSLGIIGISFELPRTTTLIRTVSSIFLFVALASNLIFSFMNFSIPAYIIINGVFLLMYVLISYSLAKAKQ